MSARPAAKAVNPGGVGMWWREHDNVRDPLVCPGSCATYWGLCQEGWRWLITPDLEEFIVQENLVSGNGRARALSQICPSPQLHWTPRLCGLHFLLFL